MTKAYRMRIRKADNVCDNRVVIDGSDPDAFDPGDDCYLVDDGVARIGDIYDPVAKSATTPPAIEAAEDTARFDV